VKHDLKMNCPEALSIADVPAHCSAVKASSLHDNTKEFTVDPINFLKYLFRFG
jgi:hypothetical protein